MTSLPHPSGGFTPLAPAPDRTAALGDAAKEVFALMVGAPVTLVAGQKLATANVTGVIGIGGAFRAVLTLRGSMDTAVKIASQMLGVSADEAVPQCADAVGEICNQIAGLFKAKIGEGATSMLAIPMVVVGKDYALHSVRGPDIELFLLHEGELIWITLDIRD